MSQTNDFKQANNPDRVYYDILQHNIGRNTDTPARFIETTETPIINNTGDYKMSVVRFQIDTPNMPVLIIQPNTNKDVSPNPNGNLNDASRYVATAYEIYYEYFHTGFQGTPLRNRHRYIAWKPQNPNVYKPTFEEYKDGKHINYEYFYCYSYSYFYDVIVNEALSNSFSAILDEAVDYSDAFFPAESNALKNQLDNWLYPPTFEWDEASQKVNIYVSPQFITLDNYNVYSNAYRFPISIGSGNTYGGLDYFATFGLGVSPNFYTLISTFPYLLERLDVNDGYTNTIDEVYRLIFKPSFLTNWIKSNSVFNNPNYFVVNNFTPNNPPTSIMTYRDYIIKGEQEWSSIDLMTPINSIVFISNTLPIIANQQSASKNKNNKDLYTPDSERSTTQHLLMITDLMTNQQGYRPNLLYVPSGQYRYITLTGNQPLNQIDINVFYQLKTGELIPFQLTNGGTASIKILFEKVVLGETKTLQFANMSMRDLKL